MEEPTPGVLRKECGIAENKRVVIFMSAKECARCEKKDVRPWRAGPRRDGT